MHMCAVHSDADSYMNANMHTIVSIFIKNQ